MSSIYNIHSESTAAAVVAGTEWDVYDSATGRIKKVTGTQVQSFVNTSPTLGGTVKVGSSTTDTVGFYGGAGVSQPTNATQAYVVNTMTQGAIGFTTTAQYTAAINLIQEMRNVLVNCGLMKGS